MKRIRLLLLLTVLTLPALAQRPVSGRVEAGASGVPLPGATVLLKGTLTGTTADSDGSFTLASVPDNAVLLVQFLGYTSREVSLPFPLPQPFVIALEEEPSALREVVVSTGYQTLPQERATGSFAHVDRERLQEQTGPTVLSRLEAVANGLMVDRGVDSRGRIMVRGLSTIQGPREPLVVVDNFPYEGDLRNLNPNDVESVTILKDAAAASIWGARAGNGVIVITTRRGRFHQPLKVEFQTSVTLQDAPDLSGAPHIASPDYIELERFLYGKGFHNSNLNSVNRPALSPVVEILNARAKGMLSEAEANARLEALGLVDVRDEYDRHMYRTGVQQQYSLGLQGGSAVNAWRLSLGYDRGLSPLEAREDRVTLQAQHTLRPSKNLELSTGLHYTLNDTESGRPGFGEVTMLNGSLYPYARFADDEGNALPVVKDYRQSFKDTAGGGRLLDWNYYPLEDWRHSRQEGGTQEVRATAGLRYQLPWGLEADVKYQFQRQQNSREQHFDGQSYLARNLVNLYTQVDPLTGALVYKVPVGGILDASDGLVQSHGLRGQLNLNRTLGNHAVAALAGAEVRDTRLTGSSSRLYGYDGGTLNFGQADYTTPQTMFTNGRTSLIPQGFSLQDQSNRFVSFFGNAAYTFKERYTLSASARQDASNLFGVKANHRWNPLWSSGLSWDLGREPFYLLPWLPTLRLRATYGLSGNVNQARAAVPTIFYRPNLSTLTGTSMAYFSNYANPELRWESSAMLNLGLDFSFKGDRVTGSVEVFRKRGDDLFGRELLDYTSGIGASVIKNVARMAGTGVDVELNTVNLRKGKFHWSSHLNLSRYRDEVTEYYLSDDQGSNFISATPPVTGMVGKPVYGIFSYPWAGLDPATGDPQGWLNGAVSKDYAAFLGSQVKLADLTYHGSAVPTSFGSLGNTLSWGNLSLTARVSYKLGYFFRRPSVQYNDLYRLGTLHGDYAARWQKPGDEAFTQVPSQPYPANSQRDLFYQGSSLLVERGDHVRLQYVTASYDLTRQTWKGLPLERLRAFANVQNLGLLWTANDHGLDPDYTLGRYNLAPSKTYSIGLQASF